jgi:hypothetical protein
MCGVLAGIVSIRYIIKKHHLEVGNNKKLIFFCDNKSVIKILNSRQELRCTVNQHRHPDVDVKLQIMHELHQLHETNCITIFEHVKGHQDTEKKGKLTTTEALNVEADALTHIARKLPDTKEYYKFPSNKVNQKINHQYINSHYPKMINLAFHSMALREHYVTKYGWTAKLIDALWWPIYFQPLAKLTDPDKLRIQKFVNNRWPTSYREPKYYNKTTSTGYCKQCHLYNQNEDHMLRCRIPSRQKIRNEWREELTTFLSEPHAPKAIREAICDGFFRWLESGRNTPGILTLPTRNAEVMQVYNDQANIGWQHFVCGKMLIKGGTLINKHLSNQKKYMFNAKLMTIHWKYILQLWEARNKEVKGETPEQAESIRRRDMIEEIKQIQETNVNLPLFARNLISRDIVLLRAMSTSSITAYLYGARTEAEAAHEHGKDLNQRILKHYFKSRQLHPMLSNHRASNDRQAKT